MHIVENKSKKGKKIYQSILLRESYRENGKVKKRTIANLSHCTPEEIAAIKLSLKYKNDISALCNLKDDIKLQEGLSVGAVWTVYQTAKKLGIEKALGTSVQGKLALWQIIARVIAQGSRLSAVRLAQTHAACDILQITQGLNEDNLYNNLAWLADNHEKIEQNLFSGKKNKEQAEIFLYDVTSSYLEGNENFFAAYGYNRDGKRNKKQIVIGLLCDKSGDPVSIEIFTGNTQDPKTLSSQIKKAADRFGIKQVTFVGDRGMIKSTQINEFPEDFHYITAITKSQICSLIKKGAIQLGLFDENLCEVEDNGLRYVLRRNPVRAKEIEANRLSKQGYIEAFIAKKNVYLNDHPRAKVATATKKIDEKLKRLKIDKWCKLQAEGRILRLQIDDNALKEGAKLDGCYVIKTDLSKDVADKQTIHDRYKDLALVEKAFRNCKTTFLEVRPVFVRTEKSTQGHVLAVMLAYKIVRYLQQSWQEFDLTVEEGLHQLSTLSAIEMTVKNQASCLKIPEPRAQSKKLLKALNIRMPTTLPHRAVHVVTRRKLTKRRKVPEK